MNAHYPNAETTRAHSASEVPELWGGIECTVARVREDYRNQADETGHTQRDADLDLVASLGIRTLRYPVLWETISPDRPDACDWRWHDRRINRMRELGIAPIAGLVHHGSGPRYTSLMDFEFPEKLARHAAHVAERYPWIDKYTPVNEPLTTARFSGLYGHWYPHGTDERCFLRTLVNQCRAVVLSMAAIRRVNPAAQLVQTEDLGKTFSTPRLQYQADYENDRRWLSFDLLCGRITREHPWHDIFLKNGISAIELDFFVDHPCPPDIVGINHYLTSERYLDERMEMFPEHHHAGNLMERYADVEAVRIDFAERPTGPLARLREAWERYRLPVAVTEAHHGNTRDEQLRWLSEVWNATVQLKSEGADIRALTVWSLFGCVDWNTLLTQRNGFYEPGVFDVRSNPPRPTALAHAAQSLATRGRFDHPVLDHGGWWLRHDRFYNAPEYPPAAAALVSRPRQILITGATGTLGRALSRIATLRGLDHVLVSRRDMDITDPASVEAAIDKHKPWAIINAAGYVRVDQAEREEERCFRENALGAEIIARSCARHGIAYVAFSSDLVFDGLLGRAYVESDAVNPMNVYGRSKAQAERLVREAFPDALVVRTSAFFGPWDQYNFVHMTLRALAEGRRVEASDAVLVSPTYVPDLAHAALDLLVDRSSGVWHLANRGEISWHELALRAAKEAGMEASGLVRVDGGERRVTTLSSERGLILPPLEGAISRFVRDVAVGFR
ncbi:family 1 glycosylhydrolase [Noviherbaspirillum pedocola]|uniref:dTDP-4-dehydrorhamnose reductase n=1 Tax=Noviherbaspirillum pedocola TaxID=2801341 RepID=A0A934T004_9BURK|nr:family 1 glycosylhydrolase [Noviherbaspirillum pedocola]MBK4738829.1 SDR family oxidoreductase [Noviherbaspirillum pedocola]